MSWLHFLMYLLIPHLSLWLMAVIFHASCFSPAVFFQRRCVCIHLRLEGSTVMNCDRLYHSRWDWSIIIAAACACCGTSGERWTGPQGAAECGKTESCCFDGLELMTKPWISKCFNNENRWERSTALKAKTPNPPACPPKNCKRSSLPAYLWGRSPAGTGTRLLPLLILMFSHTLRNLKNIKRDVWICRDLRATR